MFKGINLGSLLVLFSILIILFGTKRLRDIGNDLGAAVKNFRKGLQEENLEKNAEENNTKIPEKSSIIITGKNTTEQ